MDLTRLFDMDLLVRLGIDLVAVFLLVRGVYYTTYKRADLFLTFFAFNLSIFLIAYVLNSTEMSMGAAFGLFAVFSMLRYRTEGISTTDMTYLFLGIATGLIMAVADLPAGALAAIAALLVGFTIFLESGVLSRRELRQEILFDEVRLLAPELREALIADLKSRTGLSVHRVEIEEIDLVRDCARLAVFHYGEASAKTGKTSLPLVGRDDREAVRVGE